MLYKKLIRKILFLFKPETSHKIAFKLLDILTYLGLTEVLYKTYNHASEVVKINNLNFKNRIGIAAGLDKDADHINGLSSLGVGFIEVGTVTPIPQEGNPQPRLFRLESDNAIINRMGFNNKGVDYLLQNVAKFYNKTCNNKRPVIGINIGKNAITPFDKATDDYLSCLDKVYSYADYITINISSPNTQGLRDIQHKDYLDDFLYNISKRREQLVRTYNAYKLLALKIAPDLDFNEVRDICDLCIKHKIDIIIVSNTTVEHSLLYDNDNNKISGGLSGVPILDKSNFVLKQVSEYLANQSSKKIYLIGVGGISSVDDARLKLQNGADLVQVYSGLIYEGPGLITSLVNEL